MYNSEAHFSHFIILSVKFLKTSFVLMIRHVKLDSVDSLFSFLNQEFFLICLHFTHQEERTV